MNLKRALEIALNAHKDQVDKFGNPYLLHALSVMNKGKSEKEKIVGVLHDVVEDSNWTFEDLQREGFDEEIIAALRCVTKTDENEPYNEFIERTKMNDLAIRVKLNDLEDNMDIRRMQQVTVSDLDRLNKYLEAYKKLTSQ